MATRYKLFTLQNFAQAKLRRASVTSSRGFTLIELLLVIAIIGALATVILVSTSNSRLKARDAQRVSDMTQIQFALERYYDDSNAVSPSFPACGSGGICCSTKYISGNNSNNSNNDNCGSGGSGYWSSLIGTPYLNSIPVDPKNYYDPLGTHLNSYAYYYRRGYRKIGDYQICSSGFNSDYVIATRLENPPQVGSVVRDCGNCSFPSCGSGGT